MSSHTTVEEAFGRHAVHLMGEWESARKIYLDEQKKINFSLFSV